MPISKFDAFVRFQQRAKRRRTMKIGFVTVFVTDFDKSLDFYTKPLGMEIDYTDRKFWAQFKSGEDVSLAIQKCAPDYVEQGSKMAGRFVGVTLMVDNIEDQYNRLGAKGVEFTGRPEKQSWGGILAHLKDLDGNVLTLMQEAA
jgi:catechol 2,3-dioxygenase-like lactoylglutathione lyase family enzyme